MDEDSKTTTGTTCPTCETAMEPVHSESEWQCHGCEKTIPFAQPSAPPNPDFCDDCPHTDGDASHLHGQAVTAMETAISFLHRGEYRNASQWNLKATQFMAATVRLLCSKTERVVSEIEEVAKI